MKDTLERIITHAGNVFGIACNTTQLVNEACRRHDLGPTAAAALGRALTGSLLLAALLKGRQSVQLIFEGNGPLGKIITEAGTAGWCRGYVKNPHADVPLKNGMIDVAAGIGKAGFLRVVKDIGLKEKYTGLVQLYTSEIGEDIAYYLTESEQTPSALNIGVHLLPDGTVASAGGYLIQSLPPADEATISYLENEMAALGPVTSLLAKGNTPSEILSKLFNSIPHKSTGSTELSFRCSCSMEKMDRAILSLSQEDLGYLLEKDESIEVQCDFCSEKYLFTKSHINEIKKNK